MGSSFNRAKEVYNKRGARPFIIKSLQKAATTVLGRDSACTFYYNINRLKKYQSISPPREQFNDNLIKIQSCSYQNFFGFYDITPFGHDNSKVLFNRTETDVFPRKKSDALELCYYDFKERDVVKFGETTTWNWQKGCRLQWFPGAEDKVIYNTLINNSYGSVVLDTQSKERLREYSSPIYAVSPSGDIALSLNFSRLERLHFDYGYLNHPDPTSEEPEPSNDGIYRLDFETGSSELILSYDQLSNLVNKSEGQHNYVMNLMFSPSGNKFCFLHRYHSAGGKRVTQLLLSDIEGEDLTILESNGEPSHPIWRNDTEILCTVNRKTTYPKYTDYVLYKVETGEGRQLTELEFNFDSHPSFCPSNKDIIVCDTYPNRFGERQLFLANIETGHSVSLGSVFGPKINNIKRDLHPRWCREGGLICIDLPTYENRRALAILNVGKIIDDLSPL